MRNLFQQDRAVSQGSVRTATFLVGGLFVISAGLILVLAFAGIFGFSPTGTIGRLFTGLLQIGLGVGLLLALYIIVRLLGEILMALHRLNDRMGILSDEMGSARADTKPAAKPVAKKTTK